MLQSADSLSEQDLCVFKCRSTFLEIKDINNQVMRSIVNMPSVVLRYIERIDRKINSAEDYLNRKQIKFNEIKSLVLKKYAPSISQDTPCVYAITVDGLIFYIGETKNVFNRIIDHMFETQNYASSIICNEKGHKKYKVLLEALVNGHDIEFIILDVANAESDRKRLKDFYIEKFNPPLNTVIGVHECVGSLEEALAW